jgi:Tfp pilus assembly protein PilV
MRTGFTLLEVVLALLVLEIGVLGVAGTLLLASTTLTRAETLERAVARAEGVLDSLRSDGAPGLGGAPFAAGEVVWSVGDSGRMDLRAIGPNGEILLGVISVLPAR